MRLGRLFAVSMAVILALTIMPAAYISFTAWRDYARSEVAFDAMATFSKVLKAAETVSVERGPSNALMGSSAQNDPAWTDRLKAVREATDTAFAKLDDDLKTSRYRGSKSAREQVASLLATLADNRREIDRVGGMPNASRDPAIIRNLVDRMIALAISLWPLMNETELAIGEADPGLMKTTLTARLAANLREFAGQLGSVFAAPLAHNLPFNNDESLRLAQIRGRIDILAQQLNQSVVGAHNASIDGSADVMRRRYLDSALGLIDRLGEAGRADGHYPVSSGQFIEIYVPAMATIVQVRDAALAQSAAIAAADRGYAQKELAAAAALIAVVIVAVGSLGLVLRRRVIAPLLRVTAAVRTVTDVLLPTDAVRRDEVGELARAVVESKQRAAENDQLRERIEADRAQISQALAELRTVYDASPHGIAMLKSRIVVTCNRACEQLFGYAPGELAGQSARAIYSSDEAFEEYGTEIELILRNGKVAVLEVDAVRKSGEPFWVHMSLAAVFPGQPQSGVIAVLDDITDRRRAEEQLRASREFLARAQRVAQVGSLSIDLVNGVSEWSNEMYRIYGIDRSRHPRSFDEYLAFVHPEDHKFVQALRESLARGEAPSPMDFRIVRPDGDVRWIHAAAELERDADGAPIRLLDVHQDITERMRMDESLREANDTLGSLARIGQQLTATLDLEQIFAILNENVAAMPDAHAFSIGMLDADETRMSVPYYIEDGKRLDLDVEIAIESDRWSAWAVRENREVVDSKTEEEAAARALPGTGPMRTSLFLPLIVGDRKLGVIAFQSRRVDAFSDREKLIFRNLAAYAAVAIANADAYRRLAAVDTLRVLAKAGQELTVVLDFETLSETLLRVFSEMLELSVFFVGRLDGTTVEVPTRYEHGRRHPETLRFSIDDPERMAAQCIREQNELVRTPDQPRPIPIPGTLTTASALYRPLTVGGRRLGVISVQSTRDHVYDDRERYIFQVLAAYAAVALNNSLAYAEMEERVRRRTVELDYARGELELILENAAIGIATLTTEPDGRRIITRLNRAMEQIYGYGRDELIGQTDRIIYLNDEDHQNGSAAFRAALQKNRFIRTEAMHRHKSGRKLLLSIVGSSLDPNDLSRGTVFLVEDITARRAAEEELKRQRAFAETLAGTIQQKNDQVRALLDNSGQGFFSFGPDLVVEREFSRACVTMLDDVPTGRPVDQVLFGQDKPKADLLRSALERALSAPDPLRRDMFLSLAPREVRRGALTLDLQFKSLQDQLMMVVLTDITESRRLAEKAEQEQRRQRLIAAAVTDSRYFFDTVDAYHDFVHGHLPDLLAAPLDTARVLQEIYRQVHTLKGLLAQSSFHDAPRLLHAVEERLSGLRKASGLPDQADLAAAVSPAELEHALDGELAVLREALGENFVQEGGFIAFSAGQAGLLQDLAARLLRDQAIDTAEPRTRALLGRISRLGDVSLRDSLQRYNWVVQQVAARTEKRVAPLEVEADVDLLLNANLYGPFLRSLIHLFRNAVAHGIESPDARAATGKDEAGRIVCRFDCDSDSFQLTVADDGAGIDIDAIRRKAVTAGSVSAEAAAGLSDAEALDLIFFDGVSTSASGDEISGRGVGLSAVRAEVARLGGQVRASAEGGRGTRFVFSVPFQ